MKRRKRGPTVRESAENSPAFPQPQLNERTPVWDLGLGGFSKRELFAAAALAGLASDPAISPDGVGEQAVRMADSTIAALEGEDT